MLHLPCIIFVTALCCAWINYCHAINPGKNPKNHYCHLGNDFRKVSAYETILLQRQTLDLFTIIVHPEEYEYIKNGEFWLNFKLMSSLCNKHHVLRFHIFTDVQWIIDQGNAQGYHMHDMRTMTELHDHFMAMYKPNHHSINPVEYEFLCFYRWHLYRHVVENWRDKTHPIRRIITIDSDIVILMDIVEYYFRTVETLHYVHNNSMPIVDQDDPFDAIIVSQGSVHLFSSGGLIEYSDYIYNWYNRTYDAIVEQTKQVAGYMYKIHLHISDMQVVQAFIKTDIQKRSGCYLYASIDQAEHRFKNDQVLVEALGCIPMARYHTMMKDNEFRFRDGKFYGMDEKVPFCYMHFQGDGVKPMMKVFTRILLQNITTSDNVLISTLLNTTIPIRPFKNPDVYTLNRRIEKKKLTEGQFKLLKFKDSDIVNLPPEIMDLFPTL